MIPLTDKYHILSDIEKAQELFGRLKRLYQRIPTTTCNRQTHCCRLMPEVSYVEFLHVVGALGRLPRDVQTETMEKTVTYFFLNAVRIDRCPFLHHNACRIYEDRPFTCRAYGLWSRAYYDELVATNRRAKEPVRAAWKTLGIKLPDDVVAYQPAHCDRVTMTSGGPITDAELDLVQAEIFSLDSNLEQGMRQFRQVFFSDPSFLLTCTIIGYESCLVEKVAVAREYLSFRHKDGRSSTRGKELLERVRACFTSEKV
jgi:Fe-S-cluster containining protein